MSDRTDLHITRRQALQRAGGGFGTLALAGVLAQSGKLLGMTGGSSVIPSRTHFAPKAKRVIFLCMNGAPSHVDTFDPKPALKKHAGEKPSDKTSPSKAGGYMPSPFEFRAPGQSGEIQ